MVRLENNFIIIGPGIDYSLFFVCAYQRYSDFNHPSLGLIPMAVLLSAASTMIGFGVLALSEHLLLKSLGITSFLGISYSFIGSFAILPPLLRHIFAPVSLPEEKVTAGSKRHLKRVLARYRHMEAYPRVFACFKLKLDPMFPRLAEFLESPDTIMDIGCGYGVPAVWLLELYPRAFVFGIDPDPERIRIAGKAIGGRGELITGKAPDLPEIPVKADAVLMLDMIHMLTDEELQITLHKIYNTARTGGRLIIRVTVPSEKSFPWERLLENIRLIILKKKPHYRSVDTLGEIITSAGFRIRTAVPCDANREETWIISERTGKKKKK